MWKQQKTSNLLQQLTLAFVITVFFLDTAVGLSDKRLCADENCKTIISTGKGMINYPAGQEGMVSFKVNSNIRIKSKSAGSDPSLWGIDVNGREGYAPKRLIREEKIYISEKDLKYVVDIVKPVDQESGPSPVPVLKASEILTETTTTQQLEITKKDESIIKSPEGIMNTERPQTVTLVQHENIEIEGTKLLRLDGSVSQDGKVDQQLQIETSSMAGTEYDDDDGDGGIGDYDDEDGDADSTLEKEPTTEAASISSNTDNNDTKLPEPFKNSVETIKKVTSTETTQEQNFNENVDATANMSSTESSQKDTLKVNSLKDPSPVSPVENSKQIKEAVIDEKVPYKSSEIEESTEKSQTVTDLYPDATNNSLPASTKILEKGKISEKDVESRTKAGGVMQTSSGNSNIAYEPHKNIPENEKVESTEEISFNDTNNEALPTATVEKHVETNISDSTSLPDEKKVNIDFSTAFPPTSNTLDANLNIEENLQSNTELDKESSNKPTGSLGSNLSVETKTQFVDDTEQINTNLYSALAKETNNTQTSTEPIPRQQTTDPDSQFNKEIPIEIQSKHIESVASKNSELNGQHPTDPQIQSPQLEPFSAPAKETNITQNSTESGSEFNKETPIKIDGKHLESVASENLQLDGQHPIDAQIQSPQLDQTYGNSNDNNIGSQYNPYDYDESSNTPLPPQYDNRNDHNELPQPTDLPYNNYGQQTTEHAPTDSEPQVTAVHHPYPSTSEDSYFNQPSKVQGSAEPVQTLETSTEAYKQEENPKSQPSLTQSASVVESDKKDNRGLFATIMDTVNNILPNSKKPKHLGYDMEGRHNELDRILYSDMEATQDNNLYCEKLDTSNCPDPSKNTPHFCGKCECSLKTLITTEFTFETLLQALASKILEISEVIAFLAIVASTSLFFIFGYYCFCNSSSEGALLSKLNQLESSLLASHKENAILKHNLMTTRQHLASIEDNSFGSNDMVVSLKKELEEELLEKAKLQEQIVTLQKELENAADAGIELNKIVSELLSSQTGDESIISSVEELQKQLNEQQNTILEINASLAEKSRENSELQLMIAEQNSRYETQISDLQQDNDEIEVEKGNLLTRLEEIRTDYDKNIMSALESKNFEIKRLQSEIVELNDKVEAGHTKWQTSMAKVEALEECLKNVKRDPNVNITHVIDAANIRAELLDSQKKYNGLKERWELELDARKLAENQLQSATDEVEKIKQDFNQTEKDKLEAQTRLEVLSNYFKEKENQLQKELSLKEAMWLKQQGETTTTVDRLTTMQEEIQSLKSQNDALRAEIEAQVAAHKAQTGTLENRAHETWLAARQSDRRYDEARAEATALRRKLTVLAGGSINEVNKPTAGPSSLGDDLANAPSPIHMESPGSPMLGRMPPPPFLPPFMGPPPPFMGMPPPPPFVPPGEMRPAPLGRIMSPPPPQRSSHIDYEDYLDYEGNSSWHRHHTYSPPPRTYRSLSPTDSRYNYGTGRDLISTYDTETDFSPPPSPRESRRHGGGGGYESDKDSKSRHPYNNSKKSSGNKAPISSGSDKSYNSSSKKGNRSKSGGGGKFVV